MTLKFCGKKKILFQFIKLKMNFNEVLFNFIEYDCRFYKFLRNYCKEIIQKGVMLLKIIFIYLQVIFLNVSFKLTF